MIATNRLHADDVRRACQVYFRRTKDEMMFKRRTRYFARPRQFAMTLTRDLCVRADNHALPMSLPRIGRFYGGMDHTTVMHAMRRVYTLCADHPHKHGNDYDQLRLTLLTYRAQKQLPEIEGYAQAIEC